MVYKKKGKIYFLFRFIIGLQKYFSKHNILIHIRRSKEKLLHLKFFQLETQMNATNCTFVMLATITMILIQKSVKFFDFFILPKL